MTKKKTLTALALSGALALGGCADDNPEYHFEGTLGEEKVEFYERGMWGEYNDLVVVRPGGEKIHYYDFDNDLELEEVKVTREGTTTEFYADSRNPLVQEVMAKAQKEFDDYLAKIFEINAGPLQEK